MKWDMTIIAMLFIGSFAQAETIQVPAPKILRDLQGNLAVEGAVKQGRISTGGGQCKPIKIVDLKAVEGASLFKAEITCWGTRVESMVDIKIEGSSFEGGSGTLVNAIYINYAG